MDQQDQVVTPEAPSSNKMRMIAVAATAIALLGISIPFVWNPNEEAAVSAATAIMRMLLDGAADATDGVSAVG